MVKEGIQWNPHKLDELHKFTLLIPYIEIPTAFLEISESFFDQILEAFPDQTVFVYAKVDSQKGVFLSFEVPLGKYPEQGATLEGENPSAIAQIFLIKKRPPLSKSIYRYNWIHR